MDSREYRDGNGNRTETFRTQDENGMMPDYQHREEVFSKVVRAGKRTYFFDVKSTRNGELFLNITESRKRMTQDNRLHYEKHTIFLYKEDFEKFAEGLKEALQFIETGEYSERPERPLSDSGNFSDRNPGADFSFEDL